MLTARNPPTSSSPAISAPATTSDHGNVLPRSATAWISTTSPKAGSHTTVLPSTAPLEEMTAPGNVIATRTSASVMAPRSTGGVSPSVAVRAVGSARRLVAGEVE